MELQRDLDALRALMPETSNHELVFNVTKATLAQIELLSNEGDAAAISHQEARLAVLQEEAARRNNLDLYRRGVDAACATEGYSLTRECFGIATTGESGSYQHIYDGDPLLGARPTEGELFISEFLSSRHTKD